MERLVLLVSALEEENKAAHQLLEAYRQILSSTRHVMERRLPLRVTEARVRNTCDKATIAIMVAELTKLERMYSPHMAGEDRVRGSLCDEVDVLRLGQERGYTTGSLRAKVDVPGPEEERGCTQGSLRAAEVDVPRLGQERGHTNGSPYPAVDWDNMARLGMSLGGFGVSLPRSEALPVLACEPGTFLNIHHVELDHYGMDRVARDYSLTVAQLREKVVEERAAAIKTYNPTGAQFTPPQVNATRDLFGSILGFRTNLGPISFPSGPVKGYI